MDFSPGFCLKMPQNADMVFRIFVFEIFFRFAMTQFAQEIQKGQFCLYFIRPAILRTPSPLIPMTRSRPLTRPSRAFASGKFLSPLPKWLKSRSRCGSGEGIFSCGWRLSRLIYPEMNSVPAVNIEAELLVIGFALVKIHCMSETCPMPITLDQIVEETREMPGEVVAELIDRIMVARHGGIELSVAESWKTETDRRIAEIESGKVKVVTSEENAARIQKILRR